MVDLLNNWVAGIPNLVRGVESWLIAYDLEANLATFWMLGLCFTVLGGVKVVSWWTIKDQRDRSGLGFPLKRQNLSEAVASFAMAFLYWALLYAHYTGYEFGVWERLLARFIAAVGMAGAVIWGLRFIYALRKERGRVHE